MIKAISRKSLLYRALREARNIAVILGKRLRHVDRTAYIHPISVVSDDLQADRYAFVGRGCQIPPLVRIGKYSMLANGVAIVGDDHNWSDPSMPMQFSDRPIQGPTTIGADVWLGHGVTLMRGVTVGDGSIVGAGAVVTCDIPPYEIWAGVPARKLRDRFDPAQRRAHQEMLIGQDIGPNFAEDLAQLGVRHG